MLHKIVSLILFISLFTVGYSQDKNKVVDYSSPESFCVKGLEIKGVKYLDKNVLGHLFGISVGDTIMVPSDKITKGIEKLWKQGLFSDVKVKIAKKEGEDIFLEVQLLEQPRMSQLVIEGIKRSERESLKEKINLRNGIQVTDNVINRSVHKIKSHFLEKGFYNVDVQVIKDMDTSMVNNVNLTFNVIKGKKMKIKKLTIVGRDKLEERKLRKAMKETKQKAFYRFWKPSRYIESKFKEDKIAFINKYNEYGYRDAKILKDSVYRIDDKNLGLVIKVEEGKQYFFRDITWVGNKKYPDEMLTHFLKINSGDAYDKELLNNRLSIDEDAVSNLYLDDGYLFFNVSPHEVLIEGDSIDVEMRMFEGDQAYLNKIIIKGNTKTHDHVIRRELRTKPGQLFSKSDIIRSARELAQLGHFDPEKMNPTPKNANPSEGTVDIEYNLEERANDQLEISGGWGAGMLVGTIGLRFSNFSMKNFLKKDEWKPVPSGDGQSLSIRAQSNGQYYQAYNVSFVEPWFGGKKPNSFSVSAYYTKQTGANYYDYVNGKQVDSYMKIYGASVGLGRRVKWPDDFFTIYNEISWQRYSLKEWNGYFVFKDGLSDNISFKTRIGRNNTSQIIYPRNGSSFNLGLEFTFPYSWVDGKTYQTDNSTKGLADDADQYRWIEYHKWTFKADWYTQLIDDLVLATKTHFGYLGRYSKDRQSPFEGFLMGGSGMSGYSYYGRENIALRGYEDNSLTPGNIPANVYNKFSMELRYPISLNPSASIYVLGFIEGGNAWSDIKEFSPFTIKRSAGVGMRAFLPMLGMLGIDWGYPFDNVAGSAKKGQIHFVLGQQF